MPSPSPRVAVVGDGIFALAACAELLRRGYRVELCTSAAFPNPLAESTDISKIVRLDYGADALYTAEMERALDGWRRWNAAWREPLFHETGVAFLCREPMSPGGFEHESYRLLTARGHRLERLDAASIGRRFPAWNNRRFVDGYYNPAGGYAESSKVLRGLLAEIAEHERMAVWSGAVVDRVIERGSRVVGLGWPDGKTRSYEHVVIAAGAWTPALVPHLGAHLRSVGQPVFHLRPADAAAFSVERFPVFGADIARTGYYGFPVTASGVVKIANHGVGRAMDPDSSTRAVSAVEVAALRDFLRDALPGLADAPLDANRICVYCDTRDEHFWIARDPEREGLVVATGGSGHAFKFAPLLGEWIADALEGNSSPALDRFRWRTDLASARGQEAARHHAD